jgi:hypothetical protein
MIIPADKRYGRLKEAVFRLADLLVALQAEKANLSADQANNLLLLTYPWLATELNPTPAQDAILGQDRQLLSRFGFQGETIVAELRNILDKDQHLAECCLSPLRLAQYLGSSIVGRVAAGKRGGDSEDKFDLAYEEFETSTYRQGAFKRIVLSHLFNFEMEGNSATIADVRIERLTPDTIPRMIGEPGFQAFLHPSRAGDCFIVAEDGASAVADIEWMRTQRDKAVLFGNLLQFYKDGVVHVGYSAIYFSPEWVNQIRKPPLFFLGAPRQVPYRNGTRRWTLMTPDREELMRWWTLMKTPKIAAALENKSGKLREAVYRGGSYFDESHQKISCIERLIALAIALESLFSPSDKENLSFRISQSVAQFIGTEPAERVHIFESLRAMYSKRSKLFHGTYDVKKYDEGTFVTDDEISEWSSYIRRSLLGFLTLHFRGETSRDNVLGMIEQTNLDSVKGEELRKKADVRILVNELSQSPS